MCVAYTHACVHSHTYTHKCPHTNNNSRMWARVHMHMCTCRHTCKHEHTCTDICRCTCKHMHTYTHKHICMHGNTEHMHTHAYTFARTHVYAHARVHAHTHRRTYTHHEVNTSVHTMHTCAYMCTRTCTHAHTYACTRMYAYIHICTYTHTHTCIHAYMHTLLSTHIIIINVIKYLFCTNIWSISANPVISGVMTHARPGVCEVRIHACGWSLRFLLRTSPLSSHGEWLSVHLIWNNSKMVTDIMLGIFVKGPWYSTFITAKYEYSTQNSFYVKSKFAGECGQSPWLMLYLLEWDCCQTSGLFLSYVNKNFKNCIITSDLNSGVHLCFCSFIRKNIPTYSLLIS